MISFNIVYFYSCTFCFLLDFPPPGLYLPGSEYRSHKRGDLDLPSMDGYLQPIKITESAPMQLGMELC